MAKKLNHIQEKKINEFIKKRSERKDLDEIQQAFIDSIVLNGLNNKEVAALLFAVMRNILLMNGNKPIIEHLGLTEKDMTIDNVQLVQKILLEEYLKDVK